MRRSRDRIRVAAFLTAAAIVVGGCSLPFLERVFGPPTITVPPTLAPPSPAHPPEPSAPTASPASGDGVVLRDEALDFSLVLPPGWVVLRPGDEGWVSVYGSHHSPVEQSVISGSIKDFAVPLPQDRADILLNLAVYVQPATGRTARAIGDAYRTGIEHADRVSNARVDDVTLPAGPAALVSADRIEGSGASAPVSRILAWIVVNGSEADYFVFVCGVDDVERYRPIFEAALDSLTLD